MIAQIVGFLQLKWETWIEFLSLGLSPILAFVGILEVNWLMGALSFSASFCLL